MVEALFLFEPEKNRCSEISEAFGVQGFTGRLAPLPQMIMGHMTWWVQYGVGARSASTNIGKEPSGMPRLAARGPIQSDGAPIDVGWAAAPSVADFDGDGDLDLISGSMPMTPGGGDSSSSEDFLWYFENSGTRTEPNLQRRSFPGKGTFPKSSLGTPRAADINGDGLLDLVVSAHTNIYIYKNIGTRNAPVFEAHDKPLASILLGQRARSHLGGAIPRLEQ